ncbi:TlpA family protein disulfide reductase [Phototrophicus methaneseepsis]|uniref:TlpA family protein disulfide reductase n=1 Tax=Phototrophicus methaneseepsis TaxID=2710758 RepID=A0A7S8IF03_9CHLR|nr:TlpA disulfide reductase family protein [Phototrophicus methaneseepsis]QPC83116.1 TlpA family protein disulfide reductase [Phototrophicus methaneseepsis]
MESETQSLEERPNHGRRVNWFVLLMALNGIGLILVFAGIALRGEQSSRESTRGLIPFPSDITPVTVYGADTTNSVLGSQQFVGDVLVGQPAPDFTIRTLAGDAVSLSDFSGQPVLINFWTTWCGPCRIEMPELVRIYNARRGEGFVILAVDLTHQDSIEDVEAFVEEFEMNFPVLLDETGTASDELYHLFGLPMSVFVNREGIITRIHIGIMTAGQVDEFVNELMES